MDACGIAAAALVMLLAIAGPAPESGALPDYGFVDPAYPVAPIPRDEIELDPCPPRCSAREFAAANPSAVYKPVEPDEWIFDGESQVVWAGARAEFFLIWGDSRASSIVLWDDTMWIDPDVEFVGSATARVAAAQRYTVSKELRIPSPVADLRERAQRMRMRRSVPRLGDLEPPELEPLGNQPPEQVWTNDTPSQLIALLERISKSRAAVAGLTLGLVWLMLRLVR